MNLLSEKFIPNKNAEKYKMKTAQRAQHPVHTATGKNMLINEAHTKPESLRRKLRKSFIFTASLLDLNNKIKKIKKIIAYCPPCQHPDVFISKH